MRLFRMLSLLLILLAGLYIIDWQEVGRAFQLIPLYVFISIVLGEFVFYIVESQRLKWLLPPGFSLRAIFSSRLLTVFVGNFLPGGMALGEVLRIFLLDFEQPGQKWRIALALIANRIFGLLSLFAILALGLLNADGGSIGLFDAAGRYLLIIACSGIFISPLILNLRAMRKVLLAFIAKLKSPRLYTLFRSSYVALMQFGNTETFLKVSISSILTSLIAITQWWLVSRGLHLDIQFFQWVLFTPFVAIFTFLPIGIGAFGSQDLALYLVARVLKQSPEQFVALSLTLHSARLLGSLPGGLLIAQLWDVIGDILKKSLRFNFNTSKV